jgi:cytochrome P450
MYEMHVRHTLTSYLQLLQDLESKAMLKNFLSTDDYAAQFEIFAASIMYTLSYGVRIVTGEEWQLTSSHEILENIEAAVQPGAWIVDAFPFLNHLPAPLTPWKNTAKKWHTLWDEMLTTNMEEALQRKGWNWAKDFKASKERHQMTEEELSWNLGVLCDGGVETTNKVLRIFTLACLAHPGFISSAQKELDSVVGSSRLPDFADVEHLPYIQAVVEETFRWRHITPIGVPHATTQDDWYKGYFIPKGATIIPLFNTMRGDAALYDSPTVFRPERWIGKTHSSNFGYGRRVCPGRFIARPSVVIAIARLLWAFDIKPRDGKPLSVDESMFTEELASGPKPFKVVFVPRSEKHRQVIEAEYESVEKDAAKMLDQIREKQVSAGLGPRV